MKDQEPDEDPQLDALLAPPERGACDDDQALLSSLWAELSPRVEAQDASWLGRLRALPTPARVLLAAAAVLLAALFSVAFTPRPELAQYPVGRMALVLGTLAVLAVLIVRMALRPVHRPQPAARSVLLLVAGALSATLAFALAPEAHTLLPHTVPAPGQSLWERARPCLLFGLGTGLPVFLALHALDRGARYAAWLATAALGLAGNLALQLHCPLTGADHLAAGHASVGFVALAAVALWVLLRRPRDVATG